MGVTISRILHAGYILECEQTRIVFDPIFESPFSTNAYAFPAIRFNLELLKNESFAAVFISHYHDDHFSLESLRHIHRDTPIYMYCLHEELLTLIRDIGFTKVHSIVLNSPITIGAFTVTPHRALDEDVDSIFQIQAQGLNILNVVDSWIGYDTLDTLVKQKPWDLILWPFQTMREIEVLSPRRLQNDNLDIPFEWIEQLQKLLPRILVPSSCQFKMEEWSWYNESFFPISYKMFDDEIRNAIPQTITQRMDPGESFTITHDSLTRSLPITWIQPLDSTRPDYSFDPINKPQSTSDIAKRFPALSSKERERVERFLKHELSERYLSQEVDDQSYFYEPKQWRLTLYDELGEPTVYNYLIEKNKLNLSNVDQPQWTTELPLTKLYHALENGESLTSLYVRINDQIFSEETESLLKDADLMEDPLLRCLFNGAIGSYQKAQIRRLKQELGADVY